MIKARIKVDNCLVKLTILKQTVEHINFNGAFFTFATEAEIELRDKYVYLIGRNKEKKSDQKLFASKAAAISYAEKLHYDLIQLNKILKRNNPVAENFYTITAA